MACLRRFNWQLCNRSRGKLSAPKLAIGLAVLLCLPVAWSAEPDRPAAADDPEAFANRMEPLGVRLPYGESGMRFVQVYKPATNATLAMIESLDDVESVTIFDCLVDESCFDTLAKFKTLRQLVAYKLSTSDAAIAKLAGLPELESIQLSNCDHLTDAAFRSLASIQSLQSVKLNGVERVTPAGFQGAGFAARA